MWTRRHWIAVASGTLAAEQVTSLNIVSTKKIWDQGTHNAFTDLIRFRNQWICSFREAEKHVSPDGKIRLIVSKNGEEWKSGGLIASSVADLRDPKMSVTPKGELMIVAAGALHDTGKARHQTYVWFLKDLNRAEGPFPIGDPDFWLWRVTWHRGKGYGVGYNTTGQNFVRLYETANGRTWRVLVDRLFDQGFPNESKLLFQADNTALCLLRRDREPGSAQLGVSKPPYTEWTWKDLGVRFGGPNLIQLPNAAFLAGGRMYDGRHRTSLAWLDPVSGKLSEAVTLPSGGDSSYPGLVWENNQLWVSYYSSHEGKTAIYLSRVEVL